MFLVAISQHNGCQHLRVQLLAKDTGGWLAAAFALTACVHHRGSSLSLAVGRVHSWSGWAKTQQIPNTRALCLEPSADSRHSRGTECPLLLPVSSLFSLFVHRRGVTCASQLSEWNQKGANTHLPLFTATKARGTIDSSSVSSVRLCLSVFPPSRFGSGGRAA